MLITESDLRPSELPNAGDWQDALQKGLGRALRWAMNGACLDRPILLDACLTDLRYDRQIDEPRGPWLWQIMEATGAIDDFRERILDTLGAVSDGLAAQQLCQFCVFYAMRGDERFRHCLQSIVSEKPAPDCPWLGEEQLIELDHEAGFLYAAQARARSLSHREWDDWDDKAMMDMAIDKLGEQKVINLLARESESSPELRRFLDTWRAAAIAKAADPKRRHADRMRQYAVGDIVRAAEGGSNLVGFLRGWGMYASERDLEAVLERLFHSDDPEVMARYLCVFSNRIAALRWPDSGPFGA